MGGRIQAADKADADLAKTQADTDYLNSQEDETYSKIELAYQKAQAAIDADPTKTEVEKKTAIDALNEYSDLTAGAGVPMPINRDPASLQSYVRRLGKSGREDYARTMQSFADQVNSNPSLQEYFEVVRVSTTDAAETRDEAGKPSGGDQRRMRTLEIVLPRSNGRSTTSSQELRDRLVTGTSTGS
jgi:hypothetical protein